MICLIFIVGSSSSLLGGQLNPNFYNLQIQQEREMVSEEIQINEFENQENRRNLLSDEAQQRLEIIRSIFMSQLPTSFQIVTIPSSHSSDRHELPKAKSPIELSERQ